MNFAYPALAAFALVCPFPAALAADCTPSASDVEVTYATGASLDAGSEMVAREIFAEALARMREHLVHPCEARVRVTLCLRYPPARDHGIVLYNLVASGAEWDRGGMGHTEDLVSLVRRSYVIGALAKAGDHGGLPAWAAYSYVGFTGVRLLKP